MSETIEILRELLGKNENVSFEVFVKSPDYCNNPDIYDYWIEQEKTIPSDCNELILDGSLGGGKTWFSNYWFAYRIYKLFNGGNPQKQLGLSVSTDIFCIYFSVSMTMAKKTGFNHLYNIFQTNRWFKENAPINENRSSSIEFIGKNFYIDYGSSEGHQIGLNVWAFILDEANFRGGVGKGMSEEYEEVTQLYSQLLDRQVSRFSKPDGSVDAFAILISSASYQSSFVEKRKKIIKHEKNAKVITSAAYEVKPHRYSKEKFPVFIGCGVVEPCIIESEEHKLRLLKNSGILGTGEEESFIKNVPINLKKQFKENIVLALQNHCGVATLLQSSFMSNMKYLYESYTDDIKPVFQSFSLVSSTEDDTELIEYLMPENIEYSERPHSLFLDLSVQHDTGSLVCFRYDGKDKRGYDIHTRVFSLMIIPPKYPAQTNIRKVKQLIIDLNEYLFIVAFGSDQYQSVQLRQEITEELGLDDIRISIDSSDIPHMHWQRALVEGRIRQTSDEVLETQVQEAVHDLKRHRVLKASKSSDDVMQGNVGAFYLSDTVGKNFGDVDDLYPEGRINLVGGRSISEVLKVLGYKQ